MYDDAIKSGKTFTYEREAEEFLQRIVDDLERKMVRSQQRIDEQEAKEADATRAIDEEIEKLTAKANELVLADTFVRCNDAEPLAGRGRTSGGVEGCTGSGQ